MDFTNPKTGEKKSIVLEDCSLIILSGPARYEWQHAIPARKSDTINGIKTERDRRVSLTFGLSGEEMARFGGCTGGPHPSAM